MLEALHKILLEAVGSVPFYRGYDPLMLESFPIVTKNTIRTRFRDFASANLLPTTIVDTCIANMRSGNTMPEFREGDWFFERSSGTTGPAVWYPKSKTERTIAAIAHIMKRREFFPDLQPDKLLDVNPIFYQAVTPSEPHKSTPVWVYTDLRRRGFRHIYGQISLLYAHASSALTAGRRYDFETVEVTGEYPDETRIKVIADAFQAKVLCQYGCRETLAIGYAEPQPTPLYSLMPTVHVEILDEDDRLVTTEGVHGRIIVTSLFGRAFPIIRFETGDRGCWQFRKEQKLLQIEKERDASFIVMADGKRVSGVNIFKRLFSDALGENGEFVTGEWKVRRAPTSWRIYLEEKDLLFEPYLRKEFQQHTALFGSDPLFISTWSGWRPLEKRVLFANESRSPRPEGQNESPW